MSLIKELRYSLIYLTSFGYTRERSIFLTRNPFVRFAVENKNGGLLAPTPSSYPYLRIEAKIEIGTHLPPAHFFERWCCPSCRPPPCRHLHGYCYSATPVMQSYSFFKSWRTHQTFWLPSLLKPNRKSTTQTMLLIRKGGSKKHHAGIIFPGPSCLLPLLTRMEITFYSLPTGWFMHVDKLYKEYNRKVENWSRVSFVTIAVKCEWKNCAGRRGLLFGYSESVGTLRKYIAEIHPLRWRKAGYGYCVWNIWLS